MLHSNVEFSETNVKILFFKQFYIYQFHWFCIYSEQVLFEMPNFQSCNLKWKFRFKTFFVHGSFIEESLIFGFNFLMEVIAKFGFL